jgi:hypothetical protein
MSEKKNDEKLAERKKREQVSTKFFFKTIFFSLPPLLEAKIFISVQHIEVGSLKFPIHPVRL